MLTSLFVVFSAGAQERNAARLVRTDSSYVDVALGVNGAAGRMHDVYAPASLLQGTLDASSRQKLGRVSLYGRVGYGYEAA